MNLYPNPYRLWCSCANTRSHTSTHFCDVAKKVPSEHHPIWHPYTRGSEKPSKKSTKKGVPASLDLRLLYRITFCEINKILLLVTRQDSGEAKSWMFTTQISDSYIQLHVFKKTQKNKKNVKNIILAREAHTGTRQKWPLRRANLTVVYTILTFHTFFARRGREAAARDDFGLATGYRLASQEGSCGVRTP